MAELTYENVMVAIKKLQSLRANATSLYSDLESGSSKNYLEESETDELNSVFIPKVKNKLENIGLASGDFDKALNTLQLPPLPVTVGPTSLLSSDPSLDQSQLSQHVMQTYKWFSKMHDQAVYAYNLISMQASKKTMYNSNTKKNKKSSNSGYFAASLQQIESFALIFQRCPGITVNVIKPSCSNPLTLEVTVGQVLRALMLMRGAIVEHIVIKAFNEDLKNKETGKYSHESLSKFEVFRKINEQAKCTLLSNNSDVRPFMNWLQSYKTLFTAPCSKCNKHLLDFQLPTFRDLRTYEPCHVSCYHS